MEFYRAQINKITADVFVCSFDNELIMLRIWRITERHSNHEREREREQNLLISRKKKKTGFEFLSFVFLKKSVVTKQ